MLRFYHAHILSAIKLKSTTYTAVGNTKLLLISSLNISERPATLKGVSKIQVEIREVYRRGCMRVVRILTETLGKKNTMHFKKISTIFYFEQACQNIAAANKLNANKNING
jgi:hypothetical protein